MALGGAMKARGGPESWLTAVEALMRSALKAAAKRALKEYAVQPRTQWIRQQPAQLVLLVSNIFWCRQVAAAWPSCSVTPGLLDKSTHHSLAGAAGLSFSWRR